VGRPEKQQSIALRKRVWQQVAEALYTEEKAITANQISGVDRKTARHLLRDIARLGSQTAFAEGGLRIRDSYYYHASGKHLDLKERIAQKVAEVIPVGSSVVASPGSTVSMSVAALVELGKYVVITTNNVGVVDVSRGYSAEHIELLGGAYRHGVHATVGEAVVRRLGDLKPSIALIGVSGMDIHGGLFVRHEEELSVLRKMVEIATDLIVIAADIHKLADRDTWEFARIDELQKRKRVQLVTNKLESLKGADKERRDRAQKVFDTWNKHRTILAV